LSANDVRGIWINCWVAVVNWFCVGCLGFWTLVFDLANSSRRVAGRSGSNRTPLLIKTIIKIHKKNHCFFSLLWGLV
jgi:hypothetical protein